MVSAAFLCVIWGCMITFLGFLDRDHLCENPCILLGTK